MYLNVLILSGVDLIGPLKENDRKQYIATAVDYFITFVEAKAISNKRGSSYIYL